MELYTASLVYDIVRLELPLVAHAITPQWLLWHCNETRNKKLCPGMRDRTSLQPQLPKLLARVSFARFTCKRLIIPSLTIFWKFICFEEMLLRMFLYYWNVRQIIPRRPLLLLIWIQHFQVFKILGCRKMTVEAAQQCSKDRMEWRALVHICRWLSSKR